MSEVLNTLSWIMVAYTVYLAARTARDACKRSQDRKAYSALLARLEQEGQHHA